MIAVTTRLRFFTLPFLLAAGINNGFSQTASSEAKNELELYRDNLYALETANGYTSAQLVETLEQIADRLMALDEYAQAYAMLDRAHQIIKINEGLFTTSQFRVLHKKIENLISTGDWRTGRKLQDHLLWLYTRKNPHPDENTVADLLKASDMHLRGVVEDEPKYQNYHRRSATMHSSMALIVAQAIWHPQDPRQGQIIYEQLKHTYLQAMSIQQRRNTAQALSAGGYNKQYLTRDRGIVPRIYRGNGYLYLESLRHFYLDRETPELEAAAMTTLYRADWQVLFQQRELAIVTYADAYTELLGAGVPAPLVDELFLEPTLIPEPVFYTTVAAAVASREQGRQSRLPPELDGLIRVSFDVRSELALPNGENDNSPGSAFTGPGIALFSFTLIGVEEITQGRWPYRRQSKLGVAYNLKLIEKETVVDLQTETLIRKLTWLHFRPKLVEGIPAAVAGVISYLAVND